MNKGVDYIALISAMSNDYGDKLIMLMDAYCVDRLLDLTQEEAKIFYGILNQEADNTK